MRRKSGKTRNQSAIWAGTSFTSKLRQSARDLLDIIQERPGDVREAGEVVPDCLPGGLDQAERGADAAIGIVAPENGYARGGSGKEILDAALLDLHDQL